MTEWYCFKDRVKLDKGQVKLGYGPTEIEEEALVCPKCHAAYILEGGAVDKLIPADDSTELMPTEKCC